MSAAGHLREALPAFVWVGGWGSCRLTGSPLVSTITQFSPPRSLKSPHLSLPLGLTLFSGHDDHSSAGEVAHRAGTDHVFSAGYPAACLTPERLTRYRIRLIALPAEGWPSG